MKESVGVQSFIKRKWLVSIAVASIIVFIPSVLNRLYYLEPDDYLMNLISQGEFGEGADSYLVFINIIAGRMLKQLYGVFPGLNWFALFYLFTVIFAFSVLTYTLWELSGRYCMVFMTGLLEMAVMYHLTFTVLGYICVGCSFIYWMFIARSKRMDGKSCGAADTLLIGLLFLFGMLFRRSVLLSAVICFCPFFIWNINYLKKKKSLYAAAVIVLVYIAAALADGYAYGSSEFWKEYSSYNEARSSVLDYTAVDYGRNKEAFDGLGISENDYNCMYRWIIGDKEVFSKENLEKIADMNGNKFNIDILDIIKQMFNQKYNYYFLAAVLLLMLFADKKKMCYILSEALAVYALIASLYFRNRPVLRVMLPIYILGFMAVLFMVSVNLKNSKRAVRKGYIAAAAGILACLAVMLVYKNDLKVKEYQERNSMYEEVYDYINDNQDMLYAGSSSIINPLAYGSPMLDAGKGLNMKNVIKLGSWDIYSSRYYSQVRRYNIEPEDRLLIAMAQNDGVQYIVNGQDTNEYGMVIRFIEEHTGKKAESTLEAEFPEADIKIYKLKIY